MTDNTKGIIKGVLITTLIATGIALAKRAMKKLSGVVTHEVMQAQDVTPFTTEQVVKKTEKKSFPKELSKVLNAPADTWRRRDLTGQPYTLFGKFFRKLGIISIAAESGVGKTFLALQIAALLDFYNVLYLAFDDRTGAQMIRFEASEAMKMKKMRVLNGPMLRLMRKGVQDFTGEQCNTKAEAEYIASEAAKIEINRKKSRKEVGLKVGEDIGNLWVYNQILHAPEFADYDLIIVDKIGDLIGGIPQMTDENLEKVFIPAIETGKSLLLLTEVNKKGEISGNNTFTYWLDESIFLRDLKYNNYLLEHLKDRWSVDGKHSVFLNKISTGENSAYFKLCDNKPSVPTNKDDVDIPARIIEIIGDRIDIEFSILRNTLFAEGIKNEESIKNALRKLKNAGKVQMANGKTWAIIERLISAGTAQ